MGGAEHSLSRVFGKAIKSSPEFGGQKSVQLSLGFALLGLSCCSHSALSSSHSSSTRPSWLSDAMMWLPKRLTKSAQKRNPNFLCFPRQITDTIIDHLFFSPPLRLRPPPAAVWPPSCRRPAALGPPWSRPGSRRAEEPKTISSSLENKR